MHDAFVNLQEPCYQDTYLYIDDLKKRNTKSNNGREIETLYLEKQLVKGGSKLPLGYHILSLFGRLILLQQKHLGICHVRSGGKFHSVSQRDIYPLAQWCSQSVAQSSASPIACTGGKSQLHKASSSLLG